MLEVPKPQGAPAAADRKVAPSKNGRRQSFALFQEPWWLDAVAPDGWDEVRVERDGLVVGRLPFIRQRRFGLIVLTQPRLTPYLGPWIGENAGKYVAQLGHQHDVLRELVQGLPPHDIFRQTAHPACANCLALHWCGFEELVGYTYKINDVSDPDRIWTDFAAATRTTVRKASRTVSVVESDDVELLIRLNWETYRRQKLTPPYPDELVRRIVAACSAHQAGRLLVAIDAGEPVAADYVVFDQDCAYGLISGSNERARRSGAGYLLRWEAFQRAHEVTSAFDCCGSMIEQIEPALRTLGTRQATYRRLVRGHSRRGWLALALDSLRRR